METLGFIRQCCTDEQLGLIARETINDYVLTLETVFPNGSREILDCAAHQPVPPMTAQAVGFSPKKRSFLYYNFLFAQRSPNDLTEIRYSVIGQDCSSLIYTIHDNPVPPDGVCSGVGAIFDRPGIRFETDGISSAMSGDGTTDYGAVGDLTGKIRGSSKTGDCKGTVFTPYLPLFGHFSIIGKSLVLRQSDGTALACMNIRGYRRDHR